MPGVGTVVAGTVKRGVLTAASHLVLGPDIADGSFKVCGRGLSGVFAVVGGWVCVSMCLFVLAWVLLSVSAVIAGVWAWL